MELYRANLYGELQPNDKLLSISSSATYFSQAGVSEHTEFELGLNFGCTMIL